MASKESAFSLVNDWMEKLKNSVAGSVRFELPFSEELLVTLYYRTDVGSIPRGAYSESYPIPKYKNNPNWSKHIIGCYWCGRVKTTVNGICCSKECIYYFHEWCVERVEFFQERRFCKLPGCHWSPTEHNYVCCSRSHNKEYERMFGFIDKRQLRNLLIKGPSWYNCRDSFDKTPLVLTHNTPSKQMAEEAVRDLAKQMKSNLIHYTDIGPIPRSYKTAEHSASHFSKHDNWLTDIRGCYLCGESVTDGSEYLCSNRCYLVFNDWCRRKVLKERGIKYCVFPGCEKVTEHQYSFCSQYHLDRRDTYLGSDECYKLLQKGPHWYKNAPSDTSSENTGKSNKLSTPDITELNTLNTINISQHSQHSAVANPFKRHLVFSETLTNWLYKDSDIGPIPRSLIRFTEVSVVNKLTKSNWNTDIPMCYWCCGGDVTNTKGIACSEKCFFLFSEWCHERYYKSTFKRICKICGHPLFFEGDVCFTHSTEYSLYSKYSHLLKTSDYALGPEWYSDTKLRHIDFYNKENPSGGSSENTGNSNKHSTPDITGLNTHNSICISHPLQHENKKPATNPSHTPTQSQHSQHSAIVNPFKRHLVFSETLTDWLYKCSDIGPIPRSLIRYPEVSVMNKLTKSNWNTDIPMCYWCCGGEVTNTKGITCSEKCFFLFSEWCHERYYKSTSYRICKICGCSLIFRKDACYTHSTEYYFYSNTHLLKTSDYALGPQWYSDTKLRHIDFYNREDPFYEFTNFYPCTRLNLDAKEWKTTEHYFQAQKFVGTPHVEYVRKLDSPRSAFEYTRRSEVQKWVRPDWAKVKEEVMLKAVQEKFNQSQELGQLLIRTGDVKLFEHTRNDKFWGDGGDRRGENKLGMILMQVRFDLHAKCPFLPSTLCHIQESGSNPVSNTVVIPKDMNTPNSQIASNPGSPDTKHSADDVNYNVMFHNYSSKSDSSDLTPSNGGPLIDLKNTTSDTCTSSQNVVTQQPRTIMTINLDNKSSEQVDNESHPPHQPVSTGVSPLDQRNNKNDSSANPFNPFSIPSAT